MGDSTVRSLTQWANRRAEGFPCPFLKPVTDITKSWQGRKKEPALLTGLLYAPDGQRMLPTFTQKKNGKR